MTCEMPMHAGGRPDAIAGQAPTTMERTSDRAFVVMRTVDAPPRIVFDAWTQPTLFRRWWVPKSCGVSLISFEAEIRTGGTYRLVMGHPASEQPMAFFGRYIEVTPHARLVWTNDEGGEDGRPHHGDLRGKGRRDTASSCTSSIPRRKRSTKPWPPEAPSGWGEQFAQLDDLIVTLDAEV